MKCPISFLITWKALCFQCSDEEIRERQEVLDSATVPVQMWTWVCCAFKLIEMKLFYSSMVGRQHKRDNEMLCWLFVWWLEGGKISKDKWSFMSGNLFLEFNKSSSIIVVFITIPVLNVWALLFFITIDFSRRRVSLVYFNQVKVVFISYHKNVLLILFFLLRKMTVMFNLPYLCRVLFGQIKLK